MAADKDMLEELFRLQTSLNDYIFNKKGLQDKDGRPLTMSRLMQSAAENELGPNSDTNVWLSKFLQALNDESREVSEELLWKWWSKDTLNMENIREEIVDQLHFWISLALASGMNAKDVFECYLRKNKVNIERQNQDYSKSAKHETDHNQVS
ncbi:MAG: dUTPase [Fibrobacter sp.]|jgi:dimeric dUTPase (all-alpha-NTP-PPase superfamily)|nr:dUTPase [Fibrobacter sp.]